MWNLRRMPFYVETLHHYNNVLLKLQWQKKINISIIVGSEKMMYLAVDSNTKHFPDHKDPHSLSFVSQLHQNTQVFLFA